MAGVSTKEIKNRIRSMESTKQITKAMEMVASSKLRKAQAQVLASRPYFETLYDTLQAIAATDRELNSPYLAQRESRKAVYVVIAGDRGLAGGYNSNVIKTAMTRLDPQADLVLPIGKKAVDYFKSHGLQLLTDSYMEAEDLSVADCFTVSKDLCRRYLAGEFDRVYVIYTDFVSVLSQVPNTRQLLPLTGQDWTPDTKHSDIVYEPDSETVFAAIIPEYLGGVLYGALCESRASEQAARRTAMDAATSNADEMIDALSLQFNRARQAAITQEITEIVAGSQ